jgi:hypothetical protein
MRVLPRDVRSVPGLANAGVVAISSSVPARCYDTTAWLANWEDKMRAIVLTAALCVLIATPATAADEAMKRVFACKGDDAAMEVYIPQSTVPGGGIADAKLDRPVIGAYTLDLTDAGKGKSLESVRVSLSADKKFVSVDQFTRKLPPTQVPVGGGTVNFDNRFGTNAKCGAFNRE